MDFMESRNAQCSLKAGKMTLTVEEATPQQHGTLRSKRAVLTLFTGSKVFPEPSLREGIEQSTPVKKLENERLKNGTPTAKLWPVRTVGNIIVAPRTRQVATARLEIGRGKATPTLVCVEPAAIAIHGVLSTRVVSRVQADPERPAQDTALTKLPKQEVLKNCICVVLANFSNTPLHVPKSTMIGLAEPISETLVNQVPDKEPTKEGNNCNNALYRKLLKGKLDHLPKADREVFEPVLIKYARLFHDEESNDF
jgi:hypothetical protein